MGKLLVLALLVGLLLVPSAAHADGICMTSPTVTIPAEWAAIVQDQLENAPYLPADVRCFAITNATEYTPQQGMVSITGIIGDPVDWNIEDHATWFTLIALQSPYPGGPWIGAMKGTDEFEDIISRFPISEEAKAILGGLTDTDAIFDQGALADQVYFPFASGTSVIYGINGVHDHGNMMAVDFLSWVGDGMAPNAVYAATSGYVTNICRDETQMGLKIGNFYYLHMYNNDAITEGMAFVTHQFIGNLVPGSFDDECGYSSQQPRNYHLHWAFFPSGNQLRVEDWTLDISSEDWTSDNGVKRSTGQLLGPADWDGVFPPPPPTPQIPPTEYPPGTEGPPGSDDGDPSDGTTPHGYTLGTNFWTFLTIGLRDLAQNIANRLKAHQYISLAVSVREYAALPMVILFYTAVVNYRFPFIIVTAITVLELGRWIYAMYMLVKKAIPFAG